MRIERVDPTGSSFADWFQLVDDIEQEVAGPAAERLTARQWRTALTQDPTEDVAALLGRAEDAVVAAAWVALPLRGNTHFAELGVVVRPEARRRQLGGHMLHAVEELARSAGRRTVAAPLARLGGATDPGRIAFAERHGYRLVLDEVRRELVVPVPAELLAAIERDCRESATGYRLRVWENRCPDELVAGLAELERRMLSDAPLGGLDVDAEPWDAERVRTTEQLMTASGQRGLWAGAVDRHGELVAFTDLRITVDEPYRAVQYGTLVASEHRGHRLGMLVKIANLQQLALASPATRIVLTENGDENAPMIAINEALGFAAIGGLQTWQKAL